MKRRQSELARIVRKRLDTLALDFPEPWAAVLHAEAKALAAIVDDLKALKDKPAPSSAGAERWTHHTLLEIANRAGRLGKDQFAIEQAICDAHNAARAAAYEKGREDEYEELRKANCLDIKVE